MNVTAPGSYNPPPPNPQVANIRGMLVVCGPSGVGKGTLIGRLMAEHGDKFGFSVSHTTRGPRPGEQDGVHYHFTDMWVVRWWWWGGGVVGWGRKMGWGGFELACCSGEARTCGEGLGWARLWPVGNAMVHVQWATWTRRHARIFR